MRYGRKCFQKSTVRTLRQGIATLVVIGALGGAEPAWAACNLISGPGTAASPGTGATVVCDSAAPNPSTVPIRAQSGSNNVKVNVLAGGGLETNTDAIIVRNNSSVTNAGTLKTNGDDEYGIWTFGNSNTATNTGSISTSGSFSYGLIANLEKADILVTILSSVISFVP